MINALYSAALEYAAHGLPVFPLKPRGKSPITKNGFKDATTDAAQIQQWWRQNPHANIAMPTGSNGGVWVLDVDSPDGQAWLDKQGTLPETPMQLTHKGRHIFFAWQDGLQLRNSQRRIDGIDVRGEGGYIVLAPSIHPDGSHYEWQRSLLDVAPALAPEIIIAPFKDETRIKAPLAPLRLQTDYAGNHKGLRILSQACNRIATAPDGQQQATLNGQSFLIGSLVGRGFLHPANAYHALMQAALAMPSYSRRTWRQTDLDCMIRRALKQGATNCTL